MVEVVLSPWHVSDLETGSRRGRLLYISAEGSTYDTCNTSVAENNRVTITKGGVLNSNVFAGSTVSKFASYCIVDVAVVDFESIKCHGKHSGDSVSESGHRTGWLPRGKGHTFEVPIVASGHVPDMSCKDVARGGYHVENM